MSVSLFLAKIQPLNIDPETMRQINEIALWSFILVGLAVLTGAAWHFIPLIVESRREQQFEEARAAKDFWFDSHKSILRRGHQQLQIPEGSLEYYVCKLVFKNPKVYQTDNDVLEAAGEYSNTNPRAVYFAVDRINNKANAAWKLEDRLLKRNKERTRLNDNYF